SVLRPGVLPGSGDAALFLVGVMSKAFMVGIQLSAPFLVFSLVFNVGIGVLSKLMPQMQVYFVGAPLSILLGFLILVAVIATMMETFLDYFGVVMRDLT
ncbi:flagellar biosynthetic protein FliR, partial [Serratia marcescens]|uniref:flagellar biosynthetic protein FliR n=1 Tax=Serratia marcescens TaxID=615 RepID=UPI0019538AAD